MLSFWFPLRNGVACAGGEVVAVELRNVACADFFRADGFALKLVGAVSESFFVHLLDHVEDAAVFFGLALREVIEVRCLS